MNHSNGTSTNTLYHEQQEVHFWNLIIVLELIIEKCLDKAV